MQTFCCYFMISVIANHAPRRLGGTCICLIWAVLSYGIRGFDVQCTHAEVSVMRVFWPFAEGFVYDYLSSYPCLPHPTHTIPLPCDFWIYLWSIFAWRFVNKPLIKHTDKKILLPSHTPEWLLEAGTLGPVNTQTHTHIRTHTKQAHAW